jgi:hypothetical protein
MVRACTYTTYGKAVECHQVPDGPYGAAAGCPEGYHRPAGSGGCFGSHGDFIRDLPSLTGVGIFFGILALVLLFGMVKWFFKLAWEVVVTGMYFAGAAWVAGFILRKTNLPVPDSFKGRK